MYKLLLLCLLFSTGLYAGQWPSINLLKQTQQQFPEQAIVNIEKDPVYKRKKQYLAYPIKGIIEKLQKKSNLSITDSVLVFTASDGYKVAMPYEDAILEYGYIAFKDLSAINGDWIPFKFGHESITPAPFYLVWTNPKLDKWRYPSPFQLITITVQSAENYYDTAKPKSADTKAKQGFNLFSRYCIRCHSVNYNGGAVGPELIKQKNMIDYYPGEKLAAFILNAKSLLPKTKMPVFKDILNHDQVLSIQYYLKSMKND